MIRLVEDMDHERVDERVGAPFTCRIVSGHAVWRCRGTERGRSGMWEAYMCGCSRSERG